MTERFLNVPLRYWILLFLIVGTLAVYLPVKDHEFLLYDDYSYIVKNYYIQPGVTWENIVWAFTSGYAANWHPLTWLSHMLDYQLFGLNPTGHHHHNVLLHLLNSIFLFLVMRKMTGAEWASAFVAAVFALHPLHVESVAWASERKDVLSALFWMLTMGLYARYTQKPGVGRYLLILLMFVLGLLSKPMLVTLPFVLLLLDYWPLRRFGSPNNSPGQPFAYLLLEKVPLMLLSIGSSVVTYHVQQEAGAVSTFDRLPLEVRLGNAIVSYLQYLGKTFWPTDLAVFYPHPGDALSMTSVIVAGLALGGITTFVLIRIKRSPYLAVGWFWYLGTLVPVLGIVQVGAQAMADRYMYLPMIGLTIMLGWLAVDLAARPLGRRIVGVAFVVAVVSMTAVSMKQVGYWYNTATLFQHAVDVTERNWVAHYNVGLIHAKEGRLEEAVEHYTRTIEFAPRFTPVYYELGSVLQRMGKHEEAIPYFRISIERDSAFAKAQMDLGVSLVHVGKVEDALRHFEAAYRFSRWYGEPHRMVGMVLVERGEYNEAMKYFRRALDASPQDSLLRSEVQRLRELMNKRDNTTIKTR